MYQTHFYLVLWIASSYVLFFLKYAKVYYDHTGSDILGCYQIFHRIVLRLYLKRTRRDIVLNLSSTQVDHALNLPLLPEGYLVTVLSYLQLFYILSNLEHQMPFNYLLDALGC